MSTGNNNSSRALTAKRQRHFSVIWVLVAIVGLLTVLIVPRLAYAGGGVGGGGTGGGGGGGSETYYGFGWTTYPLVQNGGPTNGFRNGTAWKTIYNTCNQPGITEVDIFIIDDVNGNGEGYNYLSEYDNFPGQFADGQSVDNHSARAISTAQAHQDFLNAGKNGVNIANFTWGSNVAWFCHNNPNPPPAASCTATPGNQTIAPGGTTNINLHGTLPNGGNWPNSYYIRRFPTSFAGYHDITNPGVRNGTNTVNPPYSVTFTYFIASNNASQTKSGQSGGQVIGSGTCDATVNVGGVPSCTVLSPPSPPNGATIPSGITTVVTVQGTDPAGNWAPDGYTIKRFPNPQDPGYGPPVSGNPAKINIQPIAGYTGSSTFRFEIYQNGNDTSFFCTITYNVAAPVPTITCTVGVQADAPPGQTEAQMYTVNVTATGQGTGGNYSVNMAANPGAYVTGPNPQTVAIPNNPGSLTKTIYFSGYLNYEGSFAVTVTDPTGNPAANCSGTGVPVVAPYFQVWQNDAAAGGGFENPAKSCGTVAPVTYPSYVSPQAATNAGITSNAQYYGGIRGMSSTYHSKSDFGAVALGLIPNNPPSFYTLNNVFTNNQYLSFANTGVPAGGITGYLNSTSSNHCVPDYYDNTVDKTNLSTPADLSGLQTAINNCNDPNDSYHRCQIQVSGNQTLTGLTIPSGVQVTVYVAGNVTINGNITYGTSSNPDSFNPTDRASIPYFALIVKGNIEVGAATTQMDGLYVAQPVSFSGLTTNGGDFSTCDTSQGSQCTSQLIVNGAVIAQHVEPLRSHGSSQSFQNDIYGIGNTPGEIFNFVPSMVLGAPDFNAQAITPQGLYSLPPVF